MKPTFDVDIEPHKMCDMLYMLKQTLFNGKNLLQHNKNIEQELNKYASNVENLLAFPHSAPFCLAYMLQPISDQCPQ